MNWSAKSVDDVLPLDAKKRIDKACLEFEDAWRLGKLPRIEEFLETFPPEERASLLGELLLVELEYRARGGEMPSAAVYRQRFAQYGDALAAVFRTTTQDTPAYEAEQRIGRYVVQRKVAIGAFSAVYLAWDEKLERAVAIKAPRRDFLESRPDAERIIGEARAAAGLQHPGIVAVYDVIHDVDGVPLIVMEYISGSTLRDAIEARRPGTRATLELLILLADAVDFAHRQGFIHRDLKPGNVLLDETGRPHIADFGLALHESVQSSRAGESAGSWAYMSPEQVRGESHWLDGRADIWALGVILYESLTGRRPFVGDDIDQLATEILYREPKPLRQIDGQIPPALERACLKCLRKSMAERYATGGDLAADLRRVLAEIQQGAECVEAGEPGRSDVGGDGERGGAPGLPKLAWVSAVLVSLVLSAWLVSRWCPAALPLTASIDLRIWDPADSHRRSIGLRDPIGLPLRPGDQVRLEIEMSRPTYAYVVWVDSEGRVSPVYPWESGDWSRYPASERPVDHLSLPTAAAQAWTLEPSPEGMETIVLLARAAPLLNAVDFAERLGALDPQSGGRFPRVLEWRNGQPTADQDAQNRSARLTATSALDDPVLRNQQAIAQRVGDQFLLHHAISFPIASREERADEFP